MEHPGDTGALGIPVVAHLLSLASQEEDESGHDDLLESHEGLEDPPGPGWDHYQVRIDTKHTECSVNVGSTAGQSDCTAGHDVPMKTHGFFVLAAC